MENTLREIEMDRYFLIHRLDEPKSKGYLSPWRGQGDGSFLWDYISHAYLFSKDSLTDEHVLSFLNGVEYQIISVEDKALDILYKHHEYY